MNKSTESRLHATKMYTFTGLQRLKHHFKILHAFSVLVTGYFLMVKVYLPIKAGVHCRLKSFYVNLPISSQNDRVWSHRNKINR